MANEEVLGPRKTMFVLVIVVGCFAVLWPRILSPLLIGNNREQLKPNQFDREAGCCEVIFESEVAVLELLTEICNSATGDHRLSPYAAAECRRAVNDTCGVDIAAFLKRSDNVGRTTKNLLETMKRSNSTCLREQFGVPIWSVYTHTSLNSWIQSDTVKQERSPIRGGGPHPALRERGRAIPPGAPTPPSRGPVTLPPHIRVRSPLAGYFELEIKPPPIPGMRPPLGSPGGPVAAPKSSMGFVMPVYTVCIIVFFVYTLSKILFRRTGTVPYEHVTPDPQFRRRVFRDDSRASPETKLVVTAISGLVAEVQQQMEAGYAQNQQRQDVQDNHSRPYTNGTVFSDTGSVRIYASEYREKSVESQKQNELNWEPKEPQPREFAPEPKELTPEAKELTPEPKELTPEPKKLTPEPKELTPEPKEITPEPKELAPEPKKLTPGPQKLTPELEETTPESKQSTTDLKDSTPGREEHSEDSDKDFEDLIKATLQSATDETESDFKKLTEDFLDESRNIKLVTTEDLESSQQKKQSTPELLEEALKEDSPKVSEEEVTEEELEEEDDVNVANSSVKVVGMELADGSPWQPPPAPAPPPHEADEVTSIFLQTQIPQQSQVLVADFAEDRTDQPAPKAKDSPLIVSGKMTLSLIQGGPRETPERDPESTVDEFTTASAVTQDAAVKEDEPSDDEELEEIEVEEIEEEIEEEEEEEEEIPKDKK